MPHLFDPLSLRRLRLANRIVVSPMCQYSSVDGFINDWHLVHLGSRAVGGASLVFTEAAAVTADGRISPDDLGVWEDAHVDGLRRVSRFTRTQGAASGIQFAHSGRKGSTKAPWTGQGRIDREDGGWEPVGPTAEPFADNYPVPRALDAADIAGIVNAYKAATERAIEAGFDVVEIHAAHGYLIHEFLSPLTNHRTDGYGGSFDNRARLCLEIVDAVRAAWPEYQPLFVRISATDWVAGGWDIDEAVELSRRLRQHGVDLVDCSSGGIVPTAHVPMAPGYQVPFAERIRREAGLATGAVGLITTPAQADEIVRRGRADVVLLARELLRDPYWPLRAAKELGYTVPWPPQYLRAAPQGSLSR
jgi:2,4-dienoyl-CoA reductase-like NADH-dependent reductase (Old Yellow Enzyme family)